MNTIEKVARAIRNGALHGKEITTYDNLAKGPKEMYRRMAVAALEALREPTDGQMNEYVKIRTSVGEPDTVFNVSRYQSYIDAALKE